jgi:hypothetical protein
MPERPAVVDNEKGRVQFRAILTFGSCRSISSEIHSESVESEMKSIHVLAARLQIGSGRQVCIETVLGI